MWNDLRLALRGFRRSPGFALIAIATLSLGIAANTAIFSVVDSLLMRPLPVKDPERLVAIYEQRPQQAGRERNVVSSPDLVDWQTQNHSFESIAAWLGSSFNITGREEPLNVIGARATGNFFETLGVTPARGRLFTTGEEAASVCVLSHALWKGRFGGRDDVVGKPIVLNEKAVTVVGILPADFQFPTREFQIWTPQEPLRFDNNRGSHNWYAVGRLKPGVTLDQARADMHVISRRLEQEYPRTNTGHYANLFALHPELVRDVRAALLVLAAAVGLVLLIACANITHLMLTRALSREREMAIRAALGASVWRLMRLVWAETLLLTAVSWACAVVLALWLVDLLAAALAPMTSGIAEIRMDARVLVFAALLSLLAAALASLAPAAFSARRRSMVKRAPRRRLRHALIVGEVALASMLCIGAGLFFRSFLRLVNVDPGFAREPALVMQIHRRIVKYEPAPVAAFSRELMERIAALPGVRAAGGISHMPLTDQQSTMNFQIEGAQPATFHEQYNAAPRVVTPGYFHAMGIPLLAGRSLSDADTLDAPRVVLVNRALARKYWPDTDPVGKRIRAGRGAWRDVVGVVGDVRHTGLADAPYPEMYFPHAQEPSTGMNVVVRAGADPLTLAPAIRGALRTIDKDQPLGKVETLETLFNASVGRPRLYAGLLMSFAIAAIVLAGVGIYGVISYSVAQRTREFGIRLALGAQRRELLSLVVRGGAGLTLLGIGVGAAGALACRGVLGKLLFGIQPEDPLTYVAAAAILMAVAALAALTPGWRATRVDPAVTLKYE